jgi:hypothetical protein
VDVIRRAWHQYCIHNRYTTHKAGSSRSEEELGAQRTRVSDPLKRWLVPSTLGGWILTALLVSQVFCAWAYAYSAREALTETSHGFQPSAGKEPAYNASIC